MAKDKAMVLTLFRLLRNHKVKAQLLIADHGDNRLAMRGEYGLLSVVNVETGF